jgi:DNA replication and repair protein RecF
MYLRSLSLSEFRNFDRLEINLSPRINFFLGENGQGKTNLLEAVHLLARGKTFRAVESNSLVRNQASLKKARLIGRFSQRDLDYSVDMVIESGKRTISINGKGANAISLIKTFPIVLFSPESLSAIKEGPEQRRSLIDELLVIHNPNQAQLLKEHLRCLRARNRVLKLISEGDIHSHELQDTLASLNKIYILLSTQLTSARLKAIREITPDFQEAMAFISKPENYLGIESEKIGDISVDYVISGESAVQWTDSEVFNALHKRHIELSAREMSYGSSLVGPHKHDIKFLFAGNDSRFYSSQGQQRALILALKIAQIVYHHRVHSNYPVLLLDDVLSELDAKKRVNLMKFLEGVSAQILITATDLTWSDQFGFDRNAIFNIASGRLESRKMASSTV